MHAGIPMFGDAAFAMLKAAELGETLINPSLRAKRGNPAH
jgi:hypothetical protein